MYAEETQLMFQLRAFIAPFHWCYPFITVLPRGWSQEEIREAPVPVMVGGSRMEGGGEEGLEGVRREVERRGGTLAERQQVFSSAVI